MTDISTEPVAVTTPPAAPPIEQPAATSPTTTSAKESPAVEHTAGGWPVVPLAVTGANATATLLAGASLVGGPVAAALAATGAVVLGATAARTSKTTTKQAKQARSSKAANAGTASAAKPTRGTRGSASGTGRVPTQPKRGSASASGSRSGRRTGASSPAPARKSAHLKPSVGPLRSASTAVPGGRKPDRVKGAPNGRAAGNGTAAAGKPRGRVGQVKSLREQARTVSPSKAGRRAETTAARRQVADARRAAKADARTTAAAKKGPVGRAVGKAAGRIGTARGAAVGKLRKARDTQTARKVAEQRAEVRKAPARARARKALWKSAARFQGRRLLAALLAGALGIVGMLTTPLGRKLGWAWLQNPGRRLYARLMKQALIEREGRDEAIREQRETEEAAADAAAQQDTEQIGDTAERPAGAVPTVPISGNSEGEIVSGFRFEEYAAEMEAAANSYEPEDAMEILAMVEGLPAALTSVANVMKILAERADSEFPLEKEVADGFSDIYGALMSAVAVAEDMGPLFRQAHEQDIARHEDPRNGPEAEKGWNV
ncbi:hypothetical protein MBT42_24960 [Streptomyces sp. MBT42]|uniref:hypothetical protein n=1 Tax=Streptomyces sp. MBT42 TaxID=1488373 RepID=UPI001E3EC473|nr:hypothetical protein [Streptomyces sp. MBT42]MCD2466790.1 hypothetical protein [Streptomyces sp. MBT42]